jgi:histidinol-phosphate phosphatase family protein
MDLHFDKTWTLFLDRDGVINNKLDNDYVRSWDSFKFLPGVLEALELMATLFRIIVVTTNQQGIGKGLYTESDLRHIHKNMLDQVHLRGGRIDKVYFCPHLAAANSDCRKPNTGMAIQAKNDFPAIDFSKSIMVGDSWSDMQFGKKLGMITVYLSNKTIQNKEEQTLINYTFTDLYAFATAIAKQKYND